MSVTLRATHLQSPRCELLLILLKMQYGLIGFQKIWNYIKYIDHEKVDEDLSYFDIFFEFELNPKFILIVVFFFHVLKSYRIALNNLELWLSVRYNIYTVYYTCNVSTWKL